MKRSNRHVWIGLGFVAASIIVAAVLFFGMKIATVSEELEPQDQTRHVVEAIPPTLPSDDAAVTATNSNEEKPPSPTKVWLIGSWRSPMEGDRPDHVSGCETDGIVTFNTDGSFRDGAGFGRYTIEGNRLTYSEIVLFDPMGEEGAQEDYTKFDEPSEARIDRLGPNVMTEDGETLHRCTS